MSNTDPEDEVDDAKAPGHGAVVAPGADAPVQRPADAEGADGERGQGHTQGRVPGARGPLGRKLQDLIVKRAGRDPTLQKFEGLQGLGQVRGLHGSPSPNGFLRAAR